MNLFTVALLRHMDSGISASDLCRPAVVLSHMSDLIERHMGGTSGAVSTHCIIDVHGFVVEIASWPMGYYQTVWCVASTLALV